MCSITTLAAIQFHFECTSRPQIIWWLSVSPESTTKSTLLRFLSSRRCVMSFHSSLFGGFCLFVFFWVAVVVVAIALFNSNWIESNQLCCSKSVSAIIFNATSISVNAHRINDGLIAGINCNTLYQLENFMGKYQNTIVPMIDRLKLILPLCDRLIVGCRCHAVPSTQFQNKIKMNWNFF